MIDLEHAIKLVAHEGIPIVISIVCIFLVIDIYRRSVNKYIPQFLNSFKTNFEAIAKSTQGINEKLGTQIQDFAHMDKKIDNVGFEVQETKKSVDNLDSFLRKKLSSE